MGAQRGMLVLLIAIAVGVPLAAADSAACSADDPRQECLNDVDVPEGGEDCTDRQKRLQRMERKWRMLLGGSCATKRSTASVVELGTTPHGQDIWIAIECNSKLFLECNLQQ